MAFNKLEATREWVNNWRKENNVGPNVTPAKEIVPFKWMHPFLKKVESNGLQIAGDPSFTVGGSKGSSRNKKIMSSGDANAPNAKEFIEKLQLGPAMFPIKKADAQGLTNFLSPHQNPRSGSLRDSGLSDEQKIQLLIRGAEIYKQASHDNRQFKSVPATGVRGDQPAGQEWKDLLIDENLLQTQKRLKA